MRLIKYRTQLQCRTDSFEPYEKTDGVVDVHVAGPSNAPRERWADEYVVTFYLNVEGEHDQAEFKVRFTDLAHVVEEARAALADSGCRRASTAEGPDYCRTCSDTVQEWVRWGEHHAADMRQAAAALRADNERLWARAEQAERGGDVTAHTDCCGEPVPTDPRGRVDHCEVIPRGHKGRHDSWWMQWSSTDSGEER